MKVEYLRTAKHSYMIVKDADYEFENYELEMVVHNDIPGLLPLQIIIGDGAAEYWYDVTGMQSLEKQFSFQPVKEDNLRLLLQSICDLKQQLEEYLLDDRDIFFSVSKIFWNRTEDRIYFCYIPGLNRQHTGEIHHLLEEILPLIDHTDSWAVQVGYDVYEASDQAEFTAAVCRKCMNDATRIATGIEKEEIRQEPLQEENITCQIPEMSGEPEKKNPLKKKKWKKKKIRTKLPEYEDSDQDAVVAETISGFHPTVCFPVEKMKKVWMLEYRGDGLEHDFYLESFPFVIGKEQGQVSGVLCAETVSRIHAQICQVEDVLYLEDNNSTNGTYLNGKLLPMNTPTELKDGDQIIFATEEYLFRQSLRYNPVPEG